MSMSICKLNRTSSLILNALFKRFQSATSATVNTDTPTITNPSVYRCSINDPAKHDVEHCGKFYRIDQEEFGKIDPFKDTLDPDYYLMANAFNENTLMIRKPAVNIIKSAAKLENNSNLAKYVLYGQEEGVGRKSIIWHLLHHFYKKKWLLFHVPHAWRLLRKQSAEIAPSERNPKLFDNSIEALRLINRFAAQNQDLLKELNIRTTNAYDWDRNEKTSAGTSFEELFKLAGARPKYAADIYGALIKEIKQQANDSKFKVFIAVEGVNSYFGDLTNIIKSDKSIMQPNELSIVNYTKKLMRNDWTNAVFLGSICSQGVILPNPNRKKKRIDNTVKWAQRRRVESVLHYEGPVDPEALLNQEARSLLEPFTEFRVEKFSKTESFNFIEYYKDRNWLQNSDCITDEGREELIFLSGSNPAQMKRVCKPL